MPSDVIIYLSVVDFHSIRATQMSTGLTARVLHHELPASRRSRSCWHRIIQKSIPGAAGIETQGDRSEQLEALGS